MKGAQEEAATKAASRVRLEKPYQYKRKAHEEQTTFNTKVQEAVKEATDALEEATDSPALDTCYSLGLVVECRIALQSYGHWVKPSDATLGKGIWSTLERFQPPELRAFTEALKSMILSSRAASTTNVMHF